LFARLGLDSLADDPPRVDADTFWDVIEAIAVDGDHDLQFRYANSLDIDQVGALGLAFKTASDLRGCLDRTARYTALLSDTARHELRPNDRGGASLVLAGRPAHRPGIRVANEAALAALLHFCRQVAPEDAMPTPTSVSFAHRAHGSTDRHRDFFRCSVSFGADVDALHLDTSFLETQTRLGDDALSEYFLDRLDDELHTTLSERGLEPRVRNVIANGLADGVPPMRLVARRLGLSERTLHRRLADEDLRYQDIVVEVRRSVATAMLTTTDRSLVDIAFLTGFSDQSAFQRAFKRWTGSTPLAVRRG
jgi:AraC-like DNA-binding protein